MKLITTSNKKVTLGKAAILFAAVFLSTAAFADICPAPEEIHYDQQFQGVVTDSGWVTRSYNANEKTPLGPSSTFSFRGARLIVDNNEGSWNLIPNKILGAYVICEYSNNDRTRGGGVLGMALRNTAYATIKGDVGIRYNGPWSGWSYVMSLTNKHSDIFMCTPYSSPSGDVTRESCVFNSTSWDQIHTFSDLSKELPQSRFGVEK